MILPRRTLITGIAALLAAPAVVRAQSIMPAKAPPHLRQALISPYAMQRECEAALRFLGGVQWDYRVLSLRPPYPAPAKINRLTALRASANIVEHRTVMG